jgi:DNA-directed RNA polymerase I, II, and III subunit RPABC2
LVVKHSLKKQTEVKKSLPKSSASDSKSKKTSAKSKTGEAVEPINKKSSRPMDEVVVYDELDFEQREITSANNEVLIGPPWLTRFERARITGARSLQLSLGAPPLIKVPPDAKSSIALAVAEVQQKALPISIRRILPNGVYQDIPIEWMK